MLDLFSSMDMSLISDVFHQNEWSVQNLLENSGDTLKTWAKGVGMVLGFAGLIYGLYAIFKIITDKQGRTAHIFQAVIAFVLGGFLIMITGDTLEKIGTGMKGTVDEIGGDKKAPAPKK